MLRKIRLLYCLVPIIGALCGCERLQEPANPVAFEACAPMPQARTAATAFVVGDAAYIVGGRTLSSDACKWHPEGYPKNMWRYDAAADAWTDLGEVPFGNRVNAVAQVVGDEVYVGLGFRGRTYTDSCYLRDWWRYEPATATWTRLADFPTHDTSGAAAFEQGGKVYVMFGFYNQYKDEIYVYDPTSDKWTVAGKAKIRTRLAGICCSNGARAFIGGGYHTENLDDWWRYDAANGSWKKCHEIPGARCFAAAIATEERFYVLGGRHFGGSLTDGFLYGDLLEYHAESDKWTLIGHLPEGRRENMVAFAIDGKPYFGLGENADGEILNDLHTWHN